MKLLVSFQRKKSIVNQMRRSAVSIPSNIAEGATRKSKIEFKQFLYIALSSAAELETQLIIAQNLKYFDDCKIFENLIIIRRQLLSLIKSLKPITLNPSSLVSISGISGQKNDALDVVKSHSSAKEI